MTRRMIAGNWKMNKLFQDVKDFFDMFGTLLEKDPIPADSEVLICPPCPLLRETKSMLPQGVFLGAQNMHHEEKGAFTGEISPLMVTDAGATHVILGHSERRYLFHETDELIKKKVIAALHHKLIPILCVGEPLEVRKEGQAAQYVEEQLQKCLPTTDVSGEIIIAYEPIWAIGTGETASTAQAQDMHAHIKSFVSMKYVRNENLTLGHLVLYGGSVKPGNAEELISQADVDGFLIGGASLSASDFHAIIQHAKRDQ